MSYASSVALNQYAARHLREAADEVSDACYGLAAMELRRRADRLEREPICPTCGHSTAPLWFGQPGSGEHSEDDGSCIACGPEIGKRCAQ